MHFRFQMVENVKKREDSISGLKGKDKKFKGDFL